MYEHTAYSSLATILIRQRLHLPVGLPGYHPSWTVLHTFSLLFRHLPPYTGLDLCFHG